MGMENVQDDRTLAMAELYFSSIVEAFHFASNQRWCPMRPAIDRSILEGLILLGKERGSLTNQDLQAALPIGFMSTEDIALIIIQLEEAGVPVELDEALLLQQRGGTVPTKRSAEIIPFPKPSKGKQKSHSGSTPPSAESRTSDGMKSGQEIGRSAHWAVIGSILTIVLIAIALATAT